MLDTNQLKEHIIKLLTSTKRAGMKNLIEYLEGSDFFTSPASTKYHGAYVGGLAEHSLNVYNCLTFHYDNLKDAEFNLPKIPNDSLVITGLLHDVCKINTYQEGFKWTKDEKNNWQQTPVFNREPLLPMGHAGKSIFIIQQFIKLTPDEALAIFWHMGAYDTSPYSTLNELGQAYTDNLLAFLLNQADMTATYVSENPNYVLIEGEENV